MRRTALVVGFFLLVAAAATVSPAVAQPTAENPSDVAADFNHDGVADLAVGVPGENDVAGAVNVLYGAGVFGSAVAAGDFNGDGFADLAAGASGENVGGAPDAGAVSVLYGSAGGLTTSGGRLFTQVGSAAETGDQFGSALAAGTSTMTGSPTWPPAPRERTSVAPLTPVRSACCTARPQG